MYEVNTPTKNQKLERIKKKKKKVPPIDATKNAF